MTRAALVMICLLFVADARAGETTFHDDRGRFTVAIPAGWREFHVGPEVNIFEKDVGKVLDASYATLHPKKGFTSAPAGAPNIPCVILAFESVVTDDLGLDEARKMVESPTGAGALKPERVSLDRARARITAEYHESIEGVGDVASLGVVCLGKHGWTRIDCYAKAAEVAAARPQFDAVVESFRYDAGHDFEEKSWFASINWLAVAGVGGLIAVRLFFRHMGREVMGSGPKPKLRRRAGAATRRRPPTR